MMIKEKKIKVCFIAPHSLFKYVSSSDNKTAIKKKKKLGFYFFNQ